MVGTLRQPVSKINIHSSGAAPGKGTPPLGLGAFKGHFDGLRVCGHTESAPGGARAHG